MLFVGPMLAGPLVTLWRAGHARVRFHTLVAFEGLCLDCQRLSAAP